MQRARDKMQARDPTGSVAEERAALDQLGALEKGLQRPQATGGQGGGGQPLPWPWQGPDQQPQPGGRDDGQGRNRDERVEIPNADQYSVPEEYRKDILDAIEQGAPRSTRTRSSAIRGDREVTPAPLQALAALALAAAAPAASPEDAAIKVGYALLEAWDTAGARRAAEELLARSGSDPEVLEYAARVRYEQGTTRGGGALGPRRLRRRLRPVARATLKELKGPPVARERALRRLLPGGQGRRPAPYALASPRAAAHRAGDQPGLPAAGEGPRRGPRDIRSLSRCLT
jgi:hypothetical protein